MTSRARTALTAVVLAFVVILPLSTVSGCSGEEPAVPMQAGVLGSSGGTASPQRSLSSPTSAPPVSASAATSPSETPRAALPPGPARWVTQRVGVGREFVTQYAGPASGVTMKVWVWVPPQYDDPKFATTRFPVLEVFPGGAGVDYTQWFGFGQPQVIAKGAAAGTITPFVLVEPQLQLSYAKDTECTDLPGQPKVGTFFEDDVPALVKGSFRVLTAQTAWGVAGASSGAYCAARLLLHRPDVFSVGATLDGYFTIDSNLAAGRTAAAKATSPLVLAATNPPAVRLRNWYGTYGGDGAVSTARDQAFAKAARPPLRFESVVVPGGRHNWTTFEKLMPAVFTFFTAALDPPG